MQALMLAAGMGKRLGKYTENGTKCMVKVNDKTLIEYAMQSVLDAGITKMTLVVGYKGDVLKTFITEKQSHGFCKNLNISFIDNPVYDTTNNIYSLFLASDILKSDDTILLESDLIYDSTIIKEVVASPDKNLAVVSPFEAWMDGTVTVLSETRDIVGVLGKSEFVWENTSSYYKTVNIYKFSADFAQQIYLPFLQAYQSAFGKNEYYEQVLKVISFLDNTSLKAHIVDGSRWYEIDDPADLEIAKTRFSSGIEHLSFMQKRFGGYWRFPSMLDFCYLVNPYFPPAAMINEFQSSFKTLLADYPSGDAQQSLLASKIFSVDPSYIAVGNGAAELIAHIPFALNGKVVVPYPTFNEYPERFGENNVVWLKAHNDDFSYTTNEILQSVKENNAKAVLLINPDNPSGHFFSKNETMSLLDALKKLDVMLVFDESFIDFAEKTERYTLLDEKILNKYPNLIVIKSISKSYGVPGIRLGILASSDSGLVHDIQRKTSIWNINSFAEYFLQIFDKYKKQYVLACDLIAKERKRFVRELSRFPQIKVFESRANYLLCKLSTPCNACDLAVTLLDDYNIFIKDLSSKRGFEDGQYIRLAVRTEHDNNVLLAALKNYFS